MVNTWFIYIFLCHLSSGPNDTTNNAFEIHVSLCMSSHRLNTVNTMMMLRDMLHDSWFMSGHQQVKVHRVFMKNAPLKPHFPQVYLCGHMVWVDGPYLLAKRVSIRTQTYPQSPSSALSPLSAGWRRIHVRMMMVTTTTHTHTRAHTHGNAWICFLPTPRIRMFWRGGDWLTGGTVLPI